MCRLYVRAHVAHGNVNYCVSHLHIVNKTLAGTIKLIKSTLLSPAWKKTGERSVVSSKSTFILSHFDMVSMETAEEMVPSDESTGGGAAFGEGGILNNSCLCSLLGTHGGGAREKKKNGVLRVRRF